MRGVFLHVMAVGRVRLLLDDFADPRNRIPGSVGVILIHFYGLTGFGSIASSFIAILIAANVVPLVIDTGGIPALDVSEKDATIESASKEVEYSPLSTLPFVTNWLSPVGNS